MMQDGRLWTTQRSAGPGFVPIAGRYVVVGDEGVDPAVARILSVNSDGHVELDVLPGSVDSHRHLLAQT